MSRLRWAKFFWEDWASDNALSLCTLAAQGLWMRLLCIAAQGDDYGMLTINGQPATSDELAKLIKPHTDPRRFARLLAELERKKVVSRDANGTLFSRRMTQIRLAFDSHSASGKAGASKRYGIVRHRQNQKQKQTPKHEGGFPLQTTPFNPPNPPSKAEGGLDPKNLNGKAGHHEPRGFHAPVSGGDPPAKRASRSHKLDQNVVVLRRPIR